MHHTPTSHSRYGAFKQTTTPTQVNQLSRLCTPKNMRYNNGSPNMRTPTAIDCTPSPNLVNPFEHGIEHLQNHVVTPGLFRPVPSPQEQAEKPFQWDIEHVALLNPVDIPVPENQLRKQNRLARSTDETAQIAIDKYFSKDLIVPSPWGETKKPVNLLAKIDEEEKNQSMRNASCQTDVHIPLHVDFQKIMRAYRLTDTQIEELSRGDSFSTSGLRRKLFGDISSDDQSNSSEDNSPEKPHVPTDDCWHSPPLTDLCSSSPVMFNGNHQHRSSLSPAHRSLHASPNLSPIATPIKPSHEGSSINCKIGQGTKLDFQPGLSFTMEDEFQISNVLAEDEDHHCDSTAMSVEAHQSSVHHYDGSCVTFDDDHLEKNNSLNTSQPVPNQGFTDTVQSQAYPSHEEMCSESQSAHQELITVSQHSNQPCHISMQNMTDTGYQTVSMTASDLSVFQEGAKNGFTQSIPGHSRDLASSTTMDYSLTQEQAVSHKEGWIPPSSSTPNKHNLSA